MGLLRPWPIHPCLIWRRLWSPVDSSHPSNTPAIVWDPNTTNQLLQCGFQGGSWILFRKGTMSPFQPKINPDSIWQTRNGLASWCHASFLAILWDGRQVHGSGHLIVNGFYFDRWLADLMCFLGHFFSSRPTWSLVLGACLGFSIHGPRKTTLCQVISSAIQLHPTAGGLRNCLNLVFESCSAYLVVNQKWNPKWRWFSTTKMALTFDPCPFPFVSLCPIFKYQTESNHLYSCLHVIPIYPANSEYITPFCFLKTNMFGQAARGKSLREGSSLRSFAVSGRLSNSIWQSQCNRSKVGPCHLQHYRIN